MTVFPSKLQGETATVAFDFTSRLAIGETISSSVVTASVFSGDDSSPSSIISGADSAVNATVLQDITAGVVGVVYTLSCAIVTSTGQELIMQGYLSVISTNPFQ